MRLFSILLLALAAQAQTIAVKHRQVMAGAPPAATITQVQSVAAGPATANPPDITCTLSATGAGNILVVAAANANETYNINTPVAAGVTFPGTPTVHLTNGSSNTLNAWVAYNIPAGVTSVQITGAAGFTGMGAICAEYHSSGGAWTTNPIVGTQTAYSGFTSIGAWDSGTATATSNGSLLLGVASDGQGGASASFTAGTNWTSVRTTGTATPMVFLEEQLNVNSGSYSATGTFAATGGAMKVQSAIIVIGPAS